jgi:hypothetical protein
MMTNWAFQSPATTLHLNTRFSRDREDGATHRTGGRIVAGIRIRVGVLRIATPARQHPTGPGATRRELRGGDNPSPQHTFGGRSYTAMEKRIGTVGISGGRLLTRALRDTRRFPSARW